MLISRRRLLQAAAAATPLVQLSDIHVGARVADEYLLDVFRRVTALSPDIVVYTGDLVSYRPEGFEAQAERMYAAPPHGRLATLGTCGNHEYGPGWAVPAVADRFVAIAEAGGIRMLQNAVADVGGCRLLASTTCGAAASTRLAPWPRSIAAARCWP